MITNRYELYIRGYRRITKVININMRNMRKKTKSTDQYLKIDIVKVELLVIVDYKATVNYIKQVSTNCPSYFE